ncbi:MAG: proline--tRNA ligase, partial [Proteobacteria bacterium]
PKEKKGVSRAEFVANLPQTLADMQQSLYDKALAFRNEHTIKIDSLDELKAYFTSKSKDENKQEAHGGFALCHVVEDAETEKLLKEMKITHRCIPLEGEVEDGKCIFTGKPSKKRAILAKSY